MPKISNNSVSIIHDDITVDADISIFYTQKDGFYAVLPTEYFAQFDHLSGSELKKFKGQKIYKGKWKSGEFKRGVCGKTEAEVLQSMKKLIKHLLSARLEQRKVIILFYDGEVSSYYHGTKFNDEHPRVYMGLALCYCTETKVEGGEPTYNIYRKVLKEPWKSDEDDNLTEDDYTMSREELRLWDEKTIVIDDTPENRAFLEQLYSATKLLIEKLDNYTKGPAELLAFINKGQKLIG